MINSSLLQKVCGWHMHLKKTEKEKKKPFYFPLFKAEHDDLRWLNLNDEKNDSNYASACHSANRVMLPGSWKI